MTAGHIDYLHWGRTHIYTPIAIVFSLVAWSAMGFRRRLYRYFTRKNRVIDETLRIIGEMLDSPVPKQSRSLHCRAFAKGVPWQSRFAISIAWLMTLAASQLAFSCRSHLPELGTVNIKRARRCAAWQRWWRAPIDRGSSSSTRWQVCHRVTRARHWPATRTIRLFWTSMATARAGVGEIDTLA